MTMSGQSFSWPTNYTIPDYQSREKTSSKFSNECSKISENVICTSWIAMALSGSIVTCDGDRVTQLFYDDNIRIDWKLGIWEKSELIKDNILTINNKETFPPLFFLKFRRHNNVLYTKWFVYHVYHYVLCVSLCIMWKYFL